MSVTLVLDFTEARETPCHSYTGVLARVDAGEWVPITITPDGCRHGSVEGLSGACDDPHIDRVQAWTVAMLMTGRETAEPMSDGLWDPVARRMEFHLRSTGRRPITDCINALPTS